jgi:lipoyl(octanoyl) transferase
LRSVTAHWLGRVPYADAHALQERLVAARIAGTVGDTLLLLEHEPVVTLGRGAHLENVVAAPSAASADEARAALGALGVDLHETGRGGDVTFHGPGQLVAYPIFDLRPDRCDVRRYVRDLARVMVDLAREHGVDAAFLEGDPKLVGVWADEASPARWPGDPRGPEGGGAARPAKLGAIGVRISRWVTMHGFAFNVSTDLARFALIVPCGISRWGVTSLAALGARVPSVADVARASLPCFARVFEAEVTLAPPSQPPLASEGGVASFDPASPGPASASGAASLPPSVVGAGGGQK